MNPSLAFLDVRAGSSTAPAEIHIRGPIDRKWDAATYSVTDTERIVLGELSKIPKGQKIKMHINSEGGSVKMATGMHNAFKTRADDMTIYNAGFMLSAATIIPPKGVRVVAPKASVFMVHEPSVTNWDSMTADDADKLKNTLNVFGEMMAGVYAERTGMTPAECRSLMKAETWMTNEQAIAKGFADDDGDEDEEDKDAEAMAVCPEIYATFRNIPENFKTLIAAANRDTPTESKTPVTAAASLSAKGGGEAGGKTAANKNQPKGITMNKIIATLVAAGFTVAPDSTEDTVLAQINALIDQRNSLKTAADTERRKRIEAHVKSKAAGLGMDDALAAKWVESIVKSDAAQELFDAMKPIEAKADKPVRRGAAPAPADAQGSNGEERLAEIRELIKTEKDPLKIAAYAKEARKLRGHEDEMFARRESVPANSDAARHN